ncbi:hypothetical protein PAN31117_02605 [Pandoraea anapnoica]|uniref:Uncharacterized protein n=1 Tax=Pandoraea anapnoica TaxID=2508301 RepID=A0A5E5A2I3_9BURK|nr:hypothetical protein [Pandoraea anapnoica]VVE67446.1 hypothetical protein PAN31117_02605 [Pandoraea anapnoica]
MIEDAGSDHKYSLSDYCFSVFFFGGPVAISSILTVFVPGEVMMSCAVRSWAEFVLQVAPKMLLVPVESKDPDFVIFYHASMISSLVVFVPSGIIYCILKLKSGFGREELERRGRIGVVRDLFLCCLGVWFSWAWFAWGYKGGGMSDFWRSRETLLFFGFFPYLMIIGVWVATLMKVIELFLFSKGGYWLKVW